MLFRPHPLSYAFKACSVVTSARAGAIEIAAMPTTTANIVHKEIFTTVRRCLTVAFARSLERCPCCTRRHHATASYEVVV
jgi:hypothetical protein